jgi:hypothetical protein
VFGFSLGRKESIEAIPDLDEVLAWQREIEPRQYAEVEVSNRYYR